MQTRRDAAAERKITEAVERKVGAVERKVGAVAERSHAAAMMARVAQPPRLAAQPTLADRTRRHLVVPAEELQAAERRVAVADQQHEAAVQLKAEVQFKAVAVVVHKAAERAAVAVGITAVVVHKAVAKHMAVAVANPTVVAVVVTN